MGFHHPKMSSQKRTMEASCQCVQGAHSCAWVKCWNHITKDGRFCPWHTCIRCPQQRTEGSRVCVEHLPTREELVCAGKTKAGKPCGMNFRCKKHEKENEEKVKRVEETLLPNPTNNPKQAAPKTEQQNPVTSTEREPKKPLFTTTETTEEELCGVEWALCFRPAMKGGKSCAQHKCAKEECGGMLMIDGATLCPRHALPDFFCQAVNCLAYVVAGGRWCFAHTCGKDGCEGKSVLLGLCELHVLSCPGRTKTGKQNPCRATVLTCQRHVKDEEQVRRVKELIDTSKASQQKDKIELRPLFTDSNPSPKFKIFLPLHAPDEDDKKLLERFYVPPFSPNPAFDEEPKHPVEKDPSPSPPPFKPPFPLTSLSDIIRLEGLIPPLSLETKKWRVLNDCIPVLKELQGLVGMEAVKKELFRHICYHANGLSTDEDLNHIMISGPPGVGKTV